MSDTERDLVQSINRNLTNGKVSTAKLEQTLVELKKDVTIVIVTHNLQQASRISDYTGFMFLGRMIEFGPTADIFSTPRSRRTRDYVTGRFG